MSQIGNRDPGLVGAALHYGLVSAGLIADGIHVHPAAVGIALRAKAGPGHIFLVSDSMSQAGTTIERFTLNGRSVSRRKGALKLVDGTLAGADLTLDAALRNTHLRLGVDLGESLKMASTYPAMAIQRQGLGVLRPGLEANLVHFSDGLATLNTWFRGTVTNGAIHREPSGP